MKKMLRTFPALLVAVCIGSIYTAGQSSGDTQGKKIEITAKRFSFSPAEITLVKGQPTTIELSSSDVTHGLRIRDLNFEVEAKPGHPGTETLTPNKTGTFKGSCNRFCGVGHGSMQMTVHVVEPGATTSQK